MICYVTYVMLYDVYAMHAIVILWDPQEDYERLCMETNMMMMTGCYHPIYVYMLGHIGDKPKIYVMYVCVVFDYV